MDRPLRSVRRRAATDPKPAPEVPARDYVERGELFNIRTPAGMRLYRVWRSSPKRAIVVPLTHEELVQFFQRVAVQQEAAQVASAGAMLGEAVAIVAAHTVRTMAGRLVRRWAVMALYRQAMAIARAHPLPEEDACPTT